MSHPLPLATPPVLASFAAADCRGDLQKEGGAFLVRLAGAAEFRVKDDLERLLGDTLDRAADAGAPQVTVDIRALTFMDGSCLKVIGRWFQKVSDGGNPFRVVIVSDPSRPWQKRSLPVLTCITGALVTIETQD